MRHAILSSSLVVLALAACDDSATDPLPPVPGAGGSSAGGAGGGAAGGNGMAAGGGDGLPLDRYEVAFRDGEESYDVVGNGIGDVAVFGDSVYLTSSDGVGLESDLWRLEWGEAATLTQFLAQPVPEEGGDGFLRGFDLVAERIHIGVIDQGVSPGGKMAVYRLDGTFDGFAQGSNQDDLNIGRPDFELYALAGADYLELSPLGATYHSIGANGSWEAVWGSGNEGFTNEVAEAVALAPSRASVYRVGLSSATPGEIRVAGIDFNAMAIQDAWALDVAMPIEGAAEPQFGDANAQFFDVAVTVRTLSLLPDARLMSCALARFAADGSEVDTIVLADLAPGTDLPHACYDVATTASGVRYVAGWLEDSEIGDVDDVIDRYQPFVVALDPDDTIRWFERLDVFRSPLLGAFPPVRDVRIELDEKGDLWLMVADDAGEVTVARWPSGLI